MREKKRHPEEKKRDQKKNNKAPSGIKRSRLAVTAAPPAERAGPLPEIPAVTARQILSRPAAF